MAKSKQDDAADLKAAAQALATGGTEPPGGATAPEAPAAPAPTGARVCSENDRAADGLWRFKVRATNCGRDIARYVLAPDDASARAEYLRHEGLDGPQADGDGKPKVMNMFVKRLPD